MIPFFTNCPVSLEAYLTLLVLTVIGSIGRAMTARFNFTEVPWIRLLRNPQQLSGWPRIRHHGLMLIPWIGRSCIVSTAILILLVISLAGPPLLAAWLSNFVFFAGLPSFVVVPILAHLGDFGDAGYVGLTFLLYHIAVTRAHHIVRKESDLMPASLLDTLPTETSEPGQTSPADEAPTPSKKRKWGRYLFYLIPNYLVPIYRYFYRATGSIIQGCADLLVHKFGEATVIDFYERRCQGMSSTNSDLLKLDQQISATTRRRDKANLIAIGRVRIVGFHVTEQDIEGFVVWRSGDEEFLPQRAVPRVRPSSPLDCHISWDSTGGIGKLVEYSKNGSGAYITCAQTVLAANRDVVVKFKNFQITGKTIHTNARYLDNTFYRGAGIGIRSEDQSRFSNFIGGSVS